jgi:hypothetical protein
MIKMSQLVGKIMRDKAEVIIIFRVGDKYYPATEENAESFEAYLHTGDEFYLQGLTNEMEV